MFSSRTRWDLSNNRLSLLLERKRRDRRAILDLTESNPTRVGLPYPAGEILAALADPESLVYEPSPRGLPAARKAVSGVFADRDLRVDPEDVFLTASTSEAYAWLFKLLAEPGDDVLVPRPSYPLFEYLTRLESLRLVSYPLVDDGGWSVDLAALEGEVGPRTRAVVVVSPNNPTGSYLKREELSAIAAICREREMALIGDEVFAEYAFATDPRRAESVLQAKDVLSFSLGGLSKLAGLPQLKVGWAAVGGPEDLRREARGRLELLGDTYLPVNSPVQQALPRLLQIAKGIRTDLRKRIHGNRMALEGVLRRAPSCRMLPSEGGWSAVLKIPATRSEEEWVLALLEEDEVLVHPGYFFDFSSPAYLVLSLLPAEESLREGVERILRRVHSR